MLLQEYPTSVTAQYMLPDQAIETGLPVIPVVAETVHELPFVLYRISELLSVIATKLVPSQIKSVMAPVAVVFTIAHVNRSVPYNIIP